MPEPSLHSLNSRPVRIEPDRQLVVLARTMQVSSTEAETSLKDGVMNYRRFGETCLGQALYRHQSVFQSEAASLSWSHVELSYFHQIVPIEVSRELVFNRLLPGLTLLRAEILLTTPSSFLLSHDWCGSEDHPERKASLEYIRVQPGHLHQYRNAMRDYCGPAASKLIESGRFGTFRAMETTATLFCAPDMTVDWNQIHLCEVNPKNFKGFGAEFAAALQVGAEGTASIDPFIGLGRIRTIPRWTFNDLVVAEDRAVKAKYETSS